MSIDNTMHCMYLNKTLYISCLTNGPKKYIRQQHITSFLSIVLFTLNDCNFIDVSVIPYWFKAAMMGKIPKTGNTLVSWLL